MIQKTVPWTKEDWPGKTLIPLMIKRPILCRWRTCLGSLSARADWPINPELNAWRLASTLAGSGILEGHVHYDFDNGAYGQAGPALSPDAGEKEIESTGKAGGWSGGLLRRSPSSTGDDFGLGFKTGAKSSF